MARTLAFVVSVSLLTPSLALAVGSKKAQYVGGTAAGVKEKAEGALETSDAAVVLDAKKDGRLEIPYSAITALEYGQTASRRVKSAVLISPVMLFSKSRHYYLTITSNDDKGVEQAAVLEIGKDIVRTSLKIIEVRSGKEIEYQDEEARKSGMAGGK